MPKTKVITIAFLVLSIILIIGIPMAVRSKSSEQDPANNVFSYNEDGTITLPIGGVTYGVRNPTTKAVLNDDDIINPVNGKINVLYEVKQNMETPEDYILVVLINGLQHEFTVGRKSVLSYPVHLGKTGEKTFGVEIEVDDGDKGDLQFVLFNQPDLLGLSGDLERDYLNLMTMINTLSNGLYIGVDSLPVEDMAMPPKNQMVDVQDVAYNEHARELFISEYPDRMQTMPSVKSGETIYVQLTNRFGVDLIYNFGLLLDWEQYTFPDGEDLMKIYMPAESSKVLKISAPLVDKNTPCQAYVVKLGHPKEYGKRYSNVFSGLRTIITKN